MDNANKQRNTAMCQLSEQEVKIMDVRNSGITYYMADDEYVDQIYGWQDPIGVDLHQVERLAKEWDMETADLLAQMHEMTDDEILMYGVYRED